MTKWCIIGAGGIADRRFIPALKKDDNNILVAIMERVPTLAAELGEKWGVPAYTDAREMLSGVECDAVYIGTPVACHKEQMEMALEYGVNVFVEKPFAMNGEEAEALLAKFKAAGKQLTVGYMMKYHNLHVKAREIIESGGVGNVSSVRASLACWYPDIDGAWRQKRALGGGGVVMDLAVHCIELLEYLLDDEIEEVKSLYSTRTFSYEVEDGAVIIFRTAGGVLGHIDVNFNVPDAATVSKVEIYGTEGSIVATGTLGQTEAGEMSYIHAPLADYDPAQGARSSEAQHFYAEGVDIYLRQIWDFCRTLESNKPDYKWAERALQVQRIVDRIYACAP